MTTYSILVTNIAPGCNNQIEQQVSVTECTTYIIRLTANSNALGPFNVYVDNDIYFSAVTRNDMLDGVVVNIQCATPTPTQTPTNTPTPSITPTNTVTPSITPTNTLTPTNTPTPTHTPTPSSTPTIFEIIITTQDGQLLLTQDGGQLITQQDSYLFSVTSGLTFSIDACFEITYNQTLYSPSSTWDLVTNLFSDSSLNNPFDGGNNWYSNGTIAKQINSSGLVVDTYVCPL